MPIATLSIDLEARLAKLQEGLDKASRLAEKHAAKIEASFARLKGVAVGVGSALAGAFAGVQVTALIGQTTEALAALNDLADATGSTVENLSALEDVGLRTGTALGDISSILVKFNGVLSEADGKNGASQALLAIGVSVEQLRRLDPAEALRQVAVALARFENDGNKARITQELFGKSVREAAPFLKNLAEQGQLNATVTTSQADAAEAFNKQMAALRTNAGAAARELTSTLLPALNSLFERVNNDGFFALFGFDKEFKSKRELAAAADEVLKLNRRATVLKNGLENGFYGPQFKRELDETNEKLRLAKQRFNELDRRGSPSPDGAKESFRRAELATGDKLSLPALPKVEGKAKIDKPAFVGPEIPESFKSAIKALENTDAARIAELNKTLDELLTMPESAARTEAIVRLREELAQLDPATQAAADRQQRLNDLLAATPSAQLEKTRSDMLLLAEAFERGAFGARESQEAIERYAEAVRARLGSINEASDEHVKRMSTFADEAQRNIQDALGDTIVRTMKGDFDSILKLWGDMLARMAAEAIAANLAKAVFGDGQGGGAGGSGGGGASGWVALLAQVFGGGRATGGSIQRGKFYAVNENGMPELATINGRDYLMAGAAGGRITPLKPSVGEGGGGPQMQTVINVQAGMTRQETMSAIQAAMGSLEARLQRSLRNGGLYSQAAMG